MQFEDLRTGTILYAGDLSNPNTIHSGIKVIQINAANIKLARINAIYLKDTVEEWWTNFPQLENSKWQVVPIGTQLPLL